ncbi:MAG: hypothetical protein HKL95_05050 [Phycisphaerae bacterium]|nr:hypothetical protein [Phycisphaerae bacterium]
MASLIDQIVRHNGMDSIFSHTSRFEFISNGGLSEVATSFKAVPKTIRLPGVKTKKETRYFFNNARALAKIAKGKAESFGQAVVAILFRDSDGTASAGRSRWADQQQSMLDGFAEENFSGGVPMVPKPKSEAWLICALKPAPYQNCAALEDRSGNDNSPNSLKNELARLLPPGGSHDGLCAKIDQGEIQTNRIDMPSFNAFRTRLGEVLGSVPPG